MKKKYIDTQNKIDDGVYALIEAGKTSKQDHLNVIFEVLDECTVKELKDRFAHVEYSACKQRLRAQGKIEIVQDQLPKLVEFLTEEEFAYIDDRRAIDIAGRLKTRVAFNKAHGRIKQALEAEHQLALYESDVVGSKDKDKDMDKYAEMLVQAATTQD